MATLRSVRRLAVLLLVAATLAGCRTKEPPPDATATTATTLLPTTIQPTTTTIDVTAAPTAAQMQDPAYWNAVLATLHHAVGDAVRATASTNKVDPASVEALDQLYGPVMFKVQHEALNDIAAGRLPGLVRPPGDPVAMVTKIMRTAERCVALAGTINYEKISPQVPANQVVISVIARDKQEGEVNPTRWKIDEVVVPNPTDDGSRLCTD